MMPPGTPFGPSSFWRQSLIGVPPAGDSAALVANVVAQVAAHYGGIAAFNVGRYNTAFYTADPGTPKADVHWDNCQHKPGIPSGLAGQFAQVPIPIGAVPASGTDAEMTVWSPSTDQLWEFWKANLQADGWHACWGGRIDGVSTSQGYFLGGFGATATGIPNVGCMGIAEARAGHVYHALTLQLAQTAAKTISWPAQRTDGLTTAVDAIPEGTRFRLDPTLNVGSLGLHPLATIVARAAQSYGFVVTDKSGGVAVLCESGNGEQAATGVDPWAALLAGSPTYNVMRGFPWARLQAMPQDYGKP